MHHINLSGNESKMNVSTTKYKCMGMRGNNTQRAELRIENKIMGKNKTPCIWIYVFRTQKEYGAKIINKLQNKWHS
jgi:hypothetical protein